MRLTPEKRLFSDRRIQACIEQLTAAIEQNGRYVSLLGAALIREILLYILEDFDDTAPEAAPFGTERGAAHSAKELCFQLMNYIQTHIYTMKNLSELAALTGYNYSYLSSRYKTVTGHTIKEYYTRRRMEEAKRLLSTQSCSISQIAEKLGFSGVYAFSKAFKAYYRMPPSDLLKKA